MIAALSRTAVPSPAPTGPGAEARRRAAEAVMVEARSVHWHGQQMTPPAAPDVAVELVRIARTIGGLSERDLRWADRIEGRTREPRP